MALPQAVLDAIDQHRDGCAALYSGATPIGDPVPLNFVLGPFAVPS